MATKNKLVWRDIAKGDIPNKNQLCLVYGQCTPATAKAPNETGFTVARYSPNDWSPYQNWWRDDFGTFMSDTWVDVKDLPIPTFGG